MSRVIKFRAYVKFLNEMQNVIEHYNTGGCLAEDYPYALAHDDVKLMQFTGSQTPKGIDIYEGDIVELKVDDRTYKGVIQWNTEFAGFMVSNGDSLDLSHMMTVIGNIHQTPELLND